MKCRKGGNQSTNKITKKKSNKKIFRKKTWKAKGEEQVQGSNWRTADYDVHACLTVQPTPSLVRLPSSCQTIRQQTICKSYPIRCNRFRIKCKCKLFGREEEEREWKIKRLTRKDEEAELKFQVRQVAASRRKERALCGNTKYAIRRSHGVAHKRMYRRGGCKRRQLKEKRSHAFAGATNSIPKMMQTKH